MTEISLSESQRAFYRLNGFIKIDQVFSAAQISEFEESVSAAVLELRDTRREKPPNSDTPAYEAAFTQILNIWRHSPAVKLLVFNKVLARLAAELMGVKGVRLYHDQALYKEVGGGCTPWHCDQYYWPLASDNTVTLWLPLQDTDAKMGPLAFSAGSHKIDLGRELPIGPDSEEVIGRKLQQLKLPCIESIFRAGDLSFHAGWTFHRAGPNQTSHPRRAMTIIYMADGACLKQPENANQEADRAAWCPGVKVGEPVASELNPILY